MSSRTFPTPCRMCGCTDDDCSDCVRRTGQPCFWVEWNLCSACADHLEDERVLARIVQVNRPFSVEMDAIRADRCVTFTLGVADAVLGCWRAGLVGDRQYCRGWAVGAALTDSSPPILQEPA